jgi:uracil-DNA glycosylase family 4
MTHPSSKRILLNYLGFLKSSGFLYLESDPVSAAAAVTAPKFTAGQTEEADLFASAGEAHPQTVAGPAPAEGPALSRDERIERIAQAMARAEACRECALGAGRNKLVYGDGDPEARIVFVGEAPGADEDASGIPFIGRAGKMLVKMVQAIGFERSEVYICNTLKCRPPGNRDPLPTEKSACEHFLIEQLQILRPQILVALGAHAAQYLCRSELTIGNLRGRWYDYHGVALRATYHPAFLLRSPSYKAKAWDDFQEIHKKYRDLNPKDKRQAWSKGGEQS